MILSRLLRHLTLKPFHCLKPPRRHMNKDHYELRKPGRSIASHLEIKIDPNNPPPAASQEFIDLRQHVATIWEKFETAEKSLVTLDDDITPDIREWISKHQKATALEIRMERARITLRLYTPRIDEADTCWRKMKEGIKALEEAAMKEPKTMEGRATIEIDVDVVSKVLATVQDIIVCAKAQLEKAKALLTSAE